MKTFNILVAFSIVFTIKAQTVSTITDGNFHDGLEVDALGNLYGSDFTGDSVYKYDTNGEVSVFKSGFSSPNGIGIDPSGDIYICDHFANTIYKYNEDGDLLDTFAGLTTPAGIKNIPGTNEMLIVEYNSSTVKILDVDTGSISTVVSGSPINGPAGIAFVGSDIFIGNFNDRKILKLDNNTVEEVAQLPASAPSGNFLGFLTAYNGVLYATQIGEGRIYSIDPASGEVSIFAGSVPGDDDGTIGSATFNQPNGIVADASNNVMYVSDAGSKNLRIISDLNLGLNENTLQVANLQLYPNPGIDTLQIVGMGTFGKATLQISDAKGKQVFNDSIETTQEGFSKLVAVDKLASGIYFVSVVDKNKTITKKWIKK